MAVEDTSAPQGLRLTIEDYPFANDGLLLWDAIKQWVTDYVTHYYPHDQLIESDKELHAWWFEIQTQGHPEKKDEPWWPALRTITDLIEILTTMIWVGSGDGGKRAMAFTTKDQPSIVDKGMCKICGCYGHEEAHCYEVIGYPTGWGTRGRGRGNRGSRNSRGGQGGASGRGYNRATASAAVQHSAGPNPNTATGPGTVTGPSAGSNGETTQFPDYLQTKCRGY
ncbi:hypothetical protein Cgig2_000475 [Carnegiea gigantea]|uniref:Lipoxygenase domain-containing protein n=1 Tax=Carnegiea gigantea TaxID=171969 RepID=A0A9Q1K457_9CARY|nr:hypothetical protein Cgig2_000475 [Carnegiea gigantea]